MVLKDVVKLLSVIFWVAAAVIALVAVLALLGLKVGTVGDDLLLAGVLALVAMAGISVSAVL